jgi:hypothetical protein
VALNTKKIKKNQSIKEFNICSFKTSGIKLNRGPIAQDHLDLD